MVESICPDDCSYPGDCSCFDSPMARIEHQDGTTRVWLGNTEITHLIDEATFWHDGDSTRYRNIIRLKLDISMDDISRVEAVSGKVRWDGLSEVPAEALIYELERRQDLPNEQAHRVRRFFKSLTGVDVEVEAN